MTIEAAQVISGPLCMSVKVWFNEVTNQYDSPFYENVPDRYALVSYCTKDIPEARARHRQNRVATLEEFKGRLNQSFVLKLKEDRVPWRPGIVVDNEGNVYFHSLIIARPNGHLFSTHLTGTWKFGINKKLEEIPVPDMRLAPSWPERMRKLAEDVFVQTRKSAVGDPGTARPPFGRYPGSGSLRPTDKVWAETDRPGVLADSCQGI